MSHNYSEQSRLLPVEESGTSLAKLSMPRLARGIARPRLFKLLDEALQKAAIWIVAPGGAGKSTLATTYIAERKLPYLWYQIDGDDADPATFFYYLGEATKQAQSSQDIFLPLLTPEYLTDIPGFARRYFRKLFTLLPQGAVLVLDNYQDIAATGVFNEILRVAIGEVPEDKNIIVISRTDTPPILARYLATGELQILDWDALRLTLDESQVIISNSLELEMDVIRALHARSDGWAAGLTLLLEQIKRKGLSGRNIGSGSLETIFHFFAAEFFDDLPKATRDFLLKTALLSHMTPTLAAAMSKNEEADQILADLHHRHFFINRRDLAETSYQYHALFREFLLSKAAENYPREHYLDLVRRAGRLLSERNRQEEAVALYLQAQDWETATPLILQQAPLLLAQGRAQIVAGWIEQLSEELVKATPWLLYWRGMSQQFIDPFTAQTILDRAYAGFLAEKNMMGQILSASSIIDIAYFLRQGFPAFMPWVEVLKKHIAIKPSFPLAEIEARALTSLVSILTFTGPQDPDLSNYADRLLKLLDYEMDVNQKVFMAGHLLYYYAMIGGNPQLCDRIVRQIGPLLHSPKLTVVSQIFWRHMCLGPCLMGGRIDEAYEINRPVRASVKDNNLQFLEFIASLYDVLVYLNAGDTEAAKPLLDRMEMMLNASQPLDLAWYYFAKLLYALTLDERDLILTYGESSLQAHSRLGMLSIEMEVSCMLAITRCESGKPEEARDYLAMPRKHKFGNSPFIHHQVHLVEAYASLLVHDYANCHESLRNAIITADRQPFFGNFFCWFPKRMMSRLCAEALRAGIEIDFVQGLIHRRGLIPEDPTIENWPWSVRIYTLGQFKLVINGRPIEDSKAQSKPLSLLEVLISLGGSEVKIERIAEFLWPDAEGDAAISAFTTTLSRLRKLIGEGAIKVKIGRVSLDERLCWVDVRAFERYIDQADRIGADHAAMQSEAEKIMALYRGPFLNDEDAQWPTRLRERLRSKFFRFLIRCGQTLCASGEVEKAIGLLERTIDLDPGCEQICQGLIASYKAAGR
jgi:LuxR family maltose regulon positive regulatory protein